MGAPGLSSQRKGLENKRRISKGILVYDCAFVSAKCSSNRFKSNPQKVKKMKSGKCPKCGSSDLKAPRHIRARGVTSAKTADLNIITCRKCMYTEFYELTEDETAHINKKAGMIFFFAAVMPTLIGIAVSVWLIWG